MNHIRKNKSRTNRTNPWGLIARLGDAIIAGQRVRPLAGPMTGSAKQSRRHDNDGGFLYRGEFFRRATLNR